MNSFPKSVCSNSFYETDGRRILRTVTKTWAKFLVLWMPLFSLQAATNTAVDVSYGAVFAAIAASADGDTVTLPAGNAIWNSTMQITKAITFAGSGTNATVISGKGGTILNVLLPADKPVRISGICFNNARGSTQPTLILNSKLTAFRVDHCWFTFGKRAIKPDGWCYGVVDHCTFHNCDIAVGPVGDDDFAWERPVEPGSTNCVCIEDNIFFFDNLSPQVLNEQVYHQEGTRTIIRHNIFDGSGYTAGNSSFIDAHGNINYYTGNPNTDLRGTILVECYSNVFHAYQGFQLTGFRGGTLFVFGNSLMCDTTTPIAFGVTEEEGWQTLLFNPLRTNWPGQDQITNSYFWDNTLNGLPVADVNVSNTNDFTFIKQGRDYWMHAPNATNVYYPYTPLQYPHPLITGPTGGFQTNKVIAVANSRLSASPATFAFSSAGSASLNGVVLTYFWTFGDGGFSVEANPVYTYPSNGTYSAQLFVSDGFTIAPAKLRIKVPSL
jgi:hypothetical protein